MHLDWIFNNDVPSVLYPIVGITLLIVLRFGKTIVSPFFDHEQKPS